MRADSAVAARSPALRDALPLTSRPRPVTRRRPSFARQIRFIDGVARLRRLRRLDLSDNLIDAIARLPQGDDDDDDGASRDDDDAPRRSTTTPCEHDDDADESDDDPFAVADDATARRLAAAARDARAAAAAAEGEEAAERLGDGDGDRARRRRPPLRELLLARNKLKSLYRAEDEEYDDENAEDEGGDAGSDRRRRADFLRPRGGALARALGALERLDIRSNRLERDGLDLRLGLVESRPPPAPPPTGNALFVEKARTAISARVPRLLA